MTASPGAAWKRLGELLKDRRIDLDPRYRNRRLFVKETGLSYSVTANIETGARDDYGPAMLKAIENAYRWQPGSIQAILAGGDPTPADPRVRISGVWASTEPVANVPIDAELRPWIDDAARHGIDPMEWDLASRLEREIFVHDVFTWGEKVQMRGVLRAYLAQARERNRGENGTPKPA